MPTSPRSTIAVLFLTHVWSRNIGERYARLRRELTGHADCLVLLQDGNLDVRSAWEEFLAALDASSDLRTYDPAKLEQRLGFAYLQPERIVPGSAHFPLLDFSLDEDYAYYWIVEYDVEYRGDWRDFFTLCHASDADLLAAHVHRHHEWPDWFWWKSLKPPFWRRMLGLPRQRQWCKAFFPISRFSAAAIQTIRSAHRNGWQGHYEALVPTALHCHGLAVRDFNHITASYLGKDQDENADPDIQSTLRWRPEITPTEFTQRGTGSLLFHPVKQAWHCDGANIIDAGEIPGRGPAG
jgi:hypothetical protein